MIMKDQENKPADERVVDFVYDELDSRQRDSYEQSLSEDKDLADAATDYRRVLDLYRGGLAQIDPPSEVKARVLEAAARHAGRPGFWERLSRWAAIPMRRYALGGAISAVVVCCAVLAVYKLKSRPIEEPQVRSSAEHTESPRPASHHPKKPKVRLIAEKGIVKGDDLPPPPPMDEPPMNLDVRTGSMAPGDMGFLDARGRGRVSLNDQTLKTGNLRINGKRKRTTLNRLRKGRPLVKKMTPSPRPRRIVSFEGRFKNRQKYQYRPNINGDSQLHPPPQAGQPGPPGSPGPPGPPSASPSKDRSRLYRTGLNYQRKGKHRLAINYFAQATRGQPRNDRVLLRWAESEIQLGNFGRAQKILAMVKAKSRAHKTKVAVLSRRLRQLKSRRAASSRARRATETASAARAQRARRARPRTRARPVPRKPPAAK